MRVFASTSAGGVCILALALALLGGTDPAWAEPTDAQRSAIKANCRADFMSNCAGVPAGGAEAMQCLEKHLASLSPGCQQALKAVSPPAAPSTAPAAAKPESAPAQPAATEASPAAETPKSEAKPAAPAAAPAATPKAVPETSAKPAAPAAAPAAPAEVPPVIGFIPPREKLMVLSNCRQDLAAHCAGVQPGGNRDLRCLLSNQAKLTPNCRGALTRLAQ